MLKSLSCFSVVLLCMFAYYSGLASALRTREAVQCGRILSYTNTSRFRHSTGLIWITAATAVSLKQPTTFFSYFAHLCSLARKCNHRLHTLVLEGRVRCRGRDGVERWHWKTSLASPYPVALMRDAASALAEKGPRLAFQQRGEVEAGAEAHREVVRAFELGQTKSQRGACELAEANGNWPPPAPVVAPLPSRERRPWPVGAQAWGRHAHQ